MKKNQFDVYKYTYHNGRVWKEKYIGTEEDGSIFLAGSECNRGPNGSRKKIPAEELNNPCTDNLCRGIYLSEEDDRFAIRFFDKCIVDRINKAKSTIIHYEKEKKILNSEGIHDCRK